MLTASGAKLLDFGLAKFRAAAGGGLRAGGFDRTAALPCRTSRPPAVRRRDGDDGASVTRGGTILGTVRYMAPEQIDGREVDARSDLFSFGAVLYEMLTGKRAFDGDSASSIRAAILEREPPPVSSLQPLVPPALDDIVRRCLAKNPDERWQTAGDVMRELKQRVRLDRSRPASAAVAVGAGHAWKWVAGIVLAALAGSAASGSSSGLDGSRHERCTAVGQIRSIAVLPLENLSGDRNRNISPTG